MNTELIYQPTKMLTQCGERGGNETKKKKNTPELTTNKKQSNSEFTAEESHPPSFLH